MSPTLGNKAAVLIVSALIIGLVVSLVSAQSYPDRHIMLIVPFAPGGAADTSARIMGDDPGETRNLWNSANHREMRDKLSREVLEWSVRSALQSRMLPTRKPQQPMPI
jgi:hypothetical protein